MITLNNFSCTHCGKCCVYLTVKLSPDDIKRIQKMGYKKRDFAEDDNFDISTGKFALKKINGQCIFLERKDSRYFCKIYEHRPEICRKYPFFSAEPIKNCTPEVLEWKT